MKVRAAGLSFSYKAFTLTVGELVFAGSRTTVIVGPNGAGKSTLLKCLGGLLVPTRGEVFVDGRGISRLGARERAGLVGYVPQEPAFTFNFRVLDFVLTGRAAFLPVFASPGHRDAGIAREALSFVGLGGFEDRPLLELSSGERRLALIARTLAQQPTVFLLDEPTTFLDPRHEMEIMGLVRRLSVERGATVIVTLHALDMALRFADEMVFMRGGRVVAAGPPGGILDEALLQSVYDVPMRIVEAAGRRVIVR